MPLVIKDTDERIWKIEDVFTMLCNLVRSKHVMDRFRKIRSNSIESKYSNQYSLFLERIENERKI